MQISWIRITLNRQWLEVMEADRAVAAYPISSARRGAGERSGSEQTPRGRHEVRELIGQDALPGTVFVARRPTGEIWSRDAAARQPERDWILSRIIWLGGLEAGRNCGGDVDTYTRYIYIHGTPEIEPIGEPRSHGCIRMTNDDVIALFARLKVGMQVRIDEFCPP